MKTQHTPGPWHTKGTVVLVSPRLIIAEVDRGAKHPATAQANANLIAAAPELLEALRALVNTTSDVFEQAKELVSLDGSPVVCEGDMITLEKTRAAIAKATQDNT